MKKNSFRIFYEAPEGTGSGGGAPSPAGGGESGEEIGEPGGQDANPNPNTGNQNNPTDPNADPISEGQDDKGFNPDKINFGNNDPDANQGTGEFDINSMDFLTSEGIDIKETKVAGAMKDLYDLGVTDPQVIGNIMRKAQEANKEPTPAEIRETLEKELTPELKANYSMINNTLKKAWGNNEEFKELIPSFMSTPKAISAMNALIQSMTPGNNPNPSPSTMDRTSSGLTLDKAIGNFDTMMADSLAKNGRSNYLDEKFRIVNEIASKLNPIDAKEFRKRYE